MAYYTEYELTVLDSSMNETRMDESILEEIRKMNAFDYIDSSVCGVYAKWLDCERDMCLLSSKFPDVLFCLKGRGDDMDDLWIDYYLHGWHHCCPATISYEDFDVNQLKDIPLPANMEYSMQRVGMRP